jgi:hypothetical protein
MLRERPPAMTSGPLYHEQSIGLGFRVKSSWTYFGPESETTSHRIWFPDSQGGFPPCSVVQYKHQFRSHIDYEPRTKAVSSCGLDISTVAGFFSAAFAGVGVLSRKSESPCGFAGVFRGLAAEGICLVYTACLARKGKVTDCLLS